MSAATVSHDTSDLHVSCTCVTCHVSCGVYVPRGLTTILRNATSLYYAMRHHYLETRHQEKSKCNSKRRQIQRFNYKFCNISFLHRRNTSVTFIITFKPSIHTAFNTSDQIYNTYDQIHNLKVVKVPTHTTFNTSANKYD